MVVGRYPQPAVVSAVAAAAELALAEELDTLAPPLPLPGLCAGGASARCLLPALEFAARVGAAAAEAEAVHSWEAAQRPAAPTVAGARRAAAALWPEPSAGRDASPVDRDASARDAIVMKMARSAGEHAILQTAIARMRAVAGASAP